MKSLLFGLLLSITTFTFCAEQFSEKPELDKTITLKTFDNYKIIAKKDFLDQSKTIQNMQADIEYENTIIPLFSKYCTKKTINQLNNFPFCKSENYNQLSLSRIIKCFLAASYLNLIKNDQLLPLIAAKFETSEGPSKKIKAQKLVYKDNIATDYLLQKWGVYYSKIYLFPNSLYYSFSSDDEYVIVTTNKEGTIFNIKQRNAKTIGGMQLFYNNPEIDSNNKLISSGGTTADNNTTFNIWDIKTGAICYKFLGNNDLLHNVYFLPENNLVASSSYNDNIKIWDLATQKCLKTYPAHIGCIVHPTQNIIVHTQKRSTKIYAINVSSEETATVDLKFLINRFKFSPDGNFIAANNYFENNTSIVAIIDTVSFKEKNRITIADINDGVTFCYVNSKTVALSYQQNDGTSVTSLWDIEENKIIESTNFFLTNICFCSPYLYGYTFEKRSDFFLDAKTLKPVPFPGIGLNNIENLLISNSQNYILVKLNQNVTLFEKKIPQGNDTLLELLGRWKERNAK